MKAVGTNPGAFNYYSVVARPTSHATNVKLQQSGFILYVYMWWWEDKALKAVLWLANNWLLKSGIQDICHKLDDDDMAHNWIQLRTRQRPPQHPLFSYCDPRLVSRLRRTKLLLISANWIIIIIFMYVKHPPGIWPEWISVLIALRIMQILFYCNLYGNSRERI